MKNKAIFYRVDLRQLWVILASSSTGTANCLASGETSPPGSLGGQAPTAELCKSGRNAFGATWGKRYELSQDSLERPERRFGSGICVDPGDRRHWYCPRGSWPGRRDRQFDEQGFELHQEC